MRITRSYVAIANGCGGLDRPINCIFIPNIPISKTFYQVYVIHSIRVSEPQLSCVIVVALLKVVIVVNSKINRGNPGCNEPNYQYCSK